MTGRADICTRISLLADHQNSLVCWKYSWTRLNQILKYAVAQICPAQHLPVKPLPIPICLEQMNHTMTCSWSPKTPCHVRHGPVSVVSYLKSKSMQWCQVVCLPAVSNTPWSYWYLHTPSPDSSASSPASLVMDPQGSIQKKDEDDHPTWDPNLLPTL